MHLPYLSLQRGTGFNIKFMRINWYTTSFNRSIHKWASKCPRLLTHSFNVGVYFTILLLPMVFTYFLISTINTTGNITANIPKLSSDVVVSTPISSSSQSPIIQLERYEKPYISIELMLPGVNLPINEIGYFVVVLLVSSVVHELGHAIAAVLDDVPIIGFGISLVYFLPMAYTEMNTDTYNKIKPWRKLRVLCAGIWHNVFLGAFGYLMLIMLPILLVPLYTTGSSVVVTDIRENSLLYSQTRGLDVGDIITEINNCEIRSSDDWYRCLLETIQSPPAYCLSSDFIHTNDESIPIKTGNAGQPECCNTENYKFNCFEYINDDEYGELEVPQFMCLNIRKTVESSINYCNRKPFRKCLNGYCIKPLINNFTTIIQVKRINRHHQTDMVYMGHPFDFTQNVRVSEFVPKTNLFRSELAETLQRFLRYLVVFSFGLGIINVMPCFYFDGQFIVNTIVHYLLLKRAKKRVRNIIALFITVLGSLLIIINVVKGFWLSLISKIF